MGIGLRFDLCAYDSAKMKSFRFKNNIFDENSVFWRISYQMMLSSYKCNTSLICKFSRKNIKSWHQKFFNFIYALDYVQTGPKSNSSYSGYKPSHRQKPCLVLKIKPEISILSWFFIVFGTFLTNRDSMRDLHWAK